MSEIRDTQIDDLAFDDQFGSGEFLQLVEFHGGQLLAQNETRGDDVDDGEAGIDALHAADAGQRKAARLHQLGSPILGDVVGDDRDTPCPIGKVHRAADRRNVL